MFKSFLGYFLNYMMFLLENILGFLKGGFNTWKNSGRSVEYINRINSHKINSYSDYKIIDVRNLFEYNNGKIKNSLNIPLFEINSNLNKLDRNGNYLIHCETGYRSMIALSLLKKNGFNNVIDISDGYQGYLKNNNVEVLN